MKTSSGRPVQRRSTRSRGRSRRSRRREVVRARRRGDRGTVAASSTVNGGEHARAEGIEGEREVDLAGERRRGRGSERGEWERGPRERGPLAPLSSRGVHRRRGGRAAARPCSDPVGGTGKGRGRRWAGPGARGCGPVWAGGGSVQMGHGSSGGRPAPFFSFSLTVSVFCFLFICLFPFLFYFI